MIDHYSKAQILVETLPFIKQYYGKTVVIKYGGSVMNDETLRDEFFNDIVLMKYVGINPVIVHGGGPEISQSLARLGKETVFVEGNRVCDQETVMVAEMVLSGKINKNIVSNINKLGGKAVGLSGKDGGLILAKKKFIEKEGKQLDIGFVGEVVSINPELIRVLLKEGYIPVISSIAMDEEGCTYNINADYVAGEIAGCLEAFRLFFLTDVDGVYKDVTDKKTFISEITKQGIQQLIAEGVISGGMLPKVNTCLHAIDKGVQKVVILNGTVKHSVLLEIFTSSGFGTMIKAEHNEGGSSCY